MFSTTLTPPPRAVSPEGHLRGFSDAVRSKPDWHIKLLDEERGLAQKWVHEAGLIEKGVPGESVDAAVRELVREATRIRYLDPVIRKDVPVPAEDKADWTQIDADVSAGRKRIEQLKYAVRDPGLKEAVGVRTADDLIPASLHGVLEQELDRLASAEVKDFHPGSDGKVQDLIHPSLYPYVQGVTRLLDTQHPLCDFKTFKTETHYHADEYNTEDMTHESVYSWLPSIFDISNEGKVTIESRINGLGTRSEHPALYKALERVFELALPMIEQSMFFDWEYAPSSSFLRWEGRAAERESGYLDKWREKKAEQAREKEVEEQVKRAEEAEREEEREREARGEALGGIRGESRFAGQKLKVIVKAANYVLLPGEEYSGTWHVEGAPHEHIRASCIYYYSCDPDIEDDGLSFRRLRTSHDRPNSEANHADEFYIWDTETSDSVDDYPSDVEDGGGFPFELGRNVALGTVPAANVGDASEGAGRGTGRVLSFPNWLQHRVAGLRNRQTSGIAPATRKILCFFVVNEHYPTVDSHGRMHFPGLWQKGPHVGPNAPPLPTTADVLPQERSRMFPYVYSALDMACRRATGGTSLPVELALDICESAGAGMTRRDAEGHRRRLMDDRRAAGGDVNEIWEADYGLCEH